MSEKDRAIRVVLRGGLGNQLFQYAAGLSISKKFGANLILDACLLPSTASVDLRAASPEQISTFHHSGFIINKNLSKKSSKICYKKLYLERVVGNLTNSKIPLLWGAYAHEKSPTMNFLPSEADSRQRITKINAYCQNLNYFASIESEITKEIKDITQPTNFYNETKEQIILEKPIGVHFRLGDYELLKRVYGELTPLYFRRGVNLIEKIQTKQNIWVFSDDISRARSLLKQVFPDAKYCLVPDESPPIESLNLISLTDCRILSNSTFSWWAAFIGGTNSINIFPRPLLPENRDKQLNNFLLPEWIQIGN